MAFLFIHNRDTWIKMYNIVDNNYLMNFIPKEVWFKLILTQACPPAALIVDLNFSIL